MNIRKISIFVFAALLMGCASSTDVGANPAEGQLAQLRSEIASLQSEIARIEKETKSGIALLDGRVSNVEDKNAEHQKNLNKLARKNLALSKLIEKYSKLSVDIPQDDCQLSIGNSGGSVSLSLLGNGCDPSENTGS